VAILFSWGIEVNPLAEKILGGEIRALARGLSLIEDRADGYMDLLKDLYRRAGRARVMGVTGPPGAGKSTLVDKLIGAYRQAGLRVAVVAVDPSSAFSGGAILGDRIRMQDRATDAGVYIRSMATRGHMGGLAMATGDALTVLDAAGFDVILVETVGVGQDEVDIVREADTVLVVLVPGLGDDIQAIKAGIMEIADVFVINKADREGVDRVEREIHAMLTLAGESMAWTPPIAKTVAVKGEGIAELLEEIDNHRRYLDSDGGREARLKLKYSQKFRDLLAERFLMEASSRHLSSEKEERLLESFLRRESDPYTAVEEILSHLRWEGEP
jgi:LAO/AO transport system kinase